MFIYVCGPYSARSDETDPSRRRQIIKDNIEKANKVAIEIAKKGHFPFIPHTMMEGWEDVDQVPRKIIMHNCFSWLEKCDALFFIGHSQGADLELERFNKLNESRDEENKMLFFENIQEIPDFSSINLASKS